MSDHNEKPPAIALSHYYSMSNAKDETIAYLNVYPRHGVLWVSLKVEGEYRRKGYATLLIQRAMADYGAEDLWGNVNAWTDRAMDDEMLTTWYKTFGFESVEGAPGMMVRKGRRRTLQYNTPWRES